MRRHHGWATPPSVRTAAATAAVGLPLSSPVAGPADGAKVSPMTMAYGCHTSVPSEDTRTVPPGAAGERHPVYPAAPEGELHPVYPDGADGFRYSAGKHFQH